jgi:hypothetical protein
MAIAICAAPSRLSASKQTFGAGQKNIAGAAAFQTGAEDVTIDTSFEQALSSLSSSS